jgi:hypothetical protein
VDYIERALGTMRESKELRTFFCGICFITYLCLITAIPLWNFTNVYHSSLNFWEKDLNQIQFNQ